MVEKGQQEIEHRLEDLLAPGATTECVTTLYDDWANQYNKNLEDAGYGGPSMLASSFAELCHDKNAETVDWGSGTGLVGAKLHSHGFTHLIAVDISEKSLDIAAEKGIYKKLVKLGNSQELFKDDEFDAIVSCGCIVPNHVKPDIFYEWVRIVKPGGLIAIANRRAYIQLTEGQESHFTEELKVEFEKVVEDLNNRKQWEMVSKTEFSGYLAPDINGLLYIFRVM